MILLQSDFTRWEICIEWMKRDHISWVDATWKMAWAIDDKLNRDLPATVDGLGSTTEMVNIATELLAMERSQLDWHFWRAWNDFWAAEAAAAAAAAIP